VRLLAAIALGSVALAAAAPGVARAAGLVALGDSYASGEGAPPFEAGTAQRGNSCHRSTRAWPAVLAERMSLPDPVSFACSGATTTGLLVSNASRKEPERRRSQVSRLAERDPDVLALTIGGNDMGFEEILRRCITSGRSCVGRYAPAGGADEIEARIAALEASLPAVYGAVAAAAPRARLVVTGYPRILPADTGDRSCAALGSISAAEQRWLIDKTTSLNAAIARAARRARVTYVDVTDALAGHELACGGVERWVNDVRAQLAYSFHPTVRGHQAIGERVADALGSSPPPEEPPADVDMALARRFRPYLLLDSKEPWRPLDADRFLAEGWHRVCRQPDGCSAIAEADDLRGFGSSPRGAQPFLQVDGQAGVEGKRFTSRDRRCGRRECGPGRIYVNVTRDPDFTYLDYWWYLRFNEAAGTRFDHQSDWEGVVVALDRDTSTFAWVGFAAHSSVWRYLRGSLSCDGVREQGSCGTESGRFGRRVNVFVADGTHAAYPARCAPPVRTAIGCRQNARVPHFEVLRVPEGNFDGGVDWAGNRDPRSLAPFGPWAWWVGAWDPGAHVESPTAQLRFRSPRRATDTTCPPDACAYKPAVGFERACRGWFGLDAVATACDADVLEARGRSTALLRLRRGFVQFGTPLSPPLQGSGDRDGVPGLAQVTGPPLAIGEAVTLEGFAGPATDLFVRAAGGGKIHEARFTDLGLENGGRATVTWTSRGELLVHRPDGSVRRPRSMVRR
jgi:lysophospholipase L1-like esterase